MMREKALNGPVEGVDGCKMVCTDNTLGSKSRREGRW
jgi:hypothetical protein